MRRAVIDDGRALAGARYRALRGTRVAVLGDGAAARLHRVRGARNRPRALPRDVPRRGGGGRDRGSRSSRPDTSDDSSSSDGDGGRSRK
eukprot:5984840-Prymnesium_polylepis.1